MHKTIKRKAATSFIIGAVLFAISMGCHPGIVEQDCDKFYGNVIIQWTYSAVCNIGNLL